MSEGLATSPPAAGHEAELRKAACLKLSRLPPFRPSALKLMNVLVEGESAFTDFEEIFKSDPALTADLLQVANSAEFGSRSRIETIRHALAFLGLERVRSLGCTIGFGSYARRGPKNDYMRLVWEHSVATAVIAEALGKAYGNPALYTGGLMHDLGRLALALGVGEAYSEKLGVPFAGIEEANAAEALEFGLRHTEAGAIVSRQWAFPPSLCEMAENHHEAVSGDPSLPINLIRQACLMASALGFPEIDCEPPVYQDSLPATLRGRPRFAADPVTEQVNSQIAAMGH